MSDSSVVFSQQYHCSFLNLGAVELHTVQCGGKNGRYLLTATDDRIWLWFAGTLQMWKQIRVCSFDSGPHMYPGLSAAVLWGDETCVVAGTKNGSVLVCALEEENN